jgi:hypothetical protein
MITMSFWTSAFGGNDVYKMPNDPKFEEYNRQLAGFDPGLGAAGRMYKGLLKKLGRGDDVSSYGQFNSIRQAGAAERKGIDESYGVGANALALGTGSAQAPLLQRMKEMALDRSAEREGMNLVNATADLSREAASGYENARQYRGNLNFQGLNQAAGNQLNYAQYLNRLVQKPGWMNTIANLAQGAGGLMTGMGAMKFGT